jgi:SAM-dependent methyltransferase
VRDALLQLLVDPITREPFSLEQPERDGTNEILRGSLRGTSGSYPIVNGIPRFVGSTELGQEQVAESFGYKWSIRSGYEHPRVNELNEESELQRYGLRTMEDFRRIFRERRRVLDAGCAAGHHSSLYVTPESHPTEWVGTDISSAIDMARERLGAIPGTNFVQADIHQLPYPDAAFDLVISRGVMHHTPSTIKAFESLVRVLEPGGEFIFFVYRKNGPIREFTDDHVRRVLAAMPPAVAWEALRPLTRLGEALSSIDAVVEVPEDVPYLGIPKGRHTVHMLIYNFIVKAFWKPGWSYDENNLISFDWYHPTYAFRHTEDELRAWCIKSGLTISHLDSRWAGFTVRAVKSGSSGAQGLS